jgi:hypothetical protein
MLPVPVYLIFLILNYKPYSEEAFATGQFPLGAGSIEVTNVRTAGDVGGDWHITRFDYEGALDAGSACVRREYFYTGMYEIPEVDDAKEWWPAETMKLKLISNEWPLYECTMDGITYSATMSPAQRIFMWRGALSE